MTNGVVMIDSYNGTGQTLGNYIDSILQQNNELGGVPSAPHKNFWDTLSYAQFTTGNVPGVTFRTQSPVPYPGPGERRRLQYRHGAAGGWPAFQP